MLDDHTDFVRSVDFSYDDKYLVSASNDKFYNFTSKDYI